MSETWLFRATNENMIAGIEVSKHSLIVVRCAPILAKAILELEWSRAKAVLERRGWEIEQLGHTETV